MTLLFFNQCVKKLNGAKMLLLYLLYFYTCVYSLNFHYSLFTEQIAAKFPKRSLDDEVHVNSGSCTILWQCESIICQIARLWQSITALPLSSEQNEPGVAVTDFPCGPLMKNIWSASVPPLLSCPQYDQAM